MGSGRELGSFRALTALPGKGFTFSSFLRRLNLNSKVRHKVGRFSPPWGGTLSRAAQGDGR